jgi:hypothetical protein
MNRLSARRRPARSLVTPADSAQLSRLSSVQRPLSFSSRTIQFLVVLLTSVQVIPLRTIEACRVLSKSSLPQGQVICIGENLKSFWHGGKNPNQFECAPCILSGPRTASFTPFRSPLIPPRLPRSAFVIPCPVQLIIVTHLAHESI